MDEKVTWLWPEGRNGEHLRCRTPDETCCFPKMTGDNPVLQQSRRRYHQPVRRPAGNRLAVAIGRLAGGATAPDLPGCACVDRRSANCLATLPLRMADAGWCAPASLLAGLAQCPAQRRTARAAAGPARAALLNLWPTSEPIQPLANLAVSPVAVHRYDGRREVEALLRWQDARADSALCLIVHGSELPHTLPFCLPDNTLWELPPLPLPPLILLACSDSNGKLIDYAATLLQRDAVTVLAAIGKPAPLRCSGLIAPAVARLADRGTHRRDAGRCSSRDAVARSRPLVSAGCGGFANERRPYPCRPLYPAVGRIRPCR